MVEIPKDPPEKVFVGKLPVGTVYRRPKGRVQHIVVDPKDVADLIGAPWNFKGLYIDFKGRLRVGNGDWQVDTTHLKFLMQPQRFPLGNPLKRTWVVPRSTGKLTIEKRKTEVVVVRYPGGTKTLWEILSEGGLSFEETTIEVQLDTVVDVRQDV